MSTAEGYDPSGPQQATEMKARTTIVGDRPDGRNSPAGIRLLVIGPDSYETYDLPSTGTVTIGRSDTSDVRIDDAQASRTHARLTIGETMSVEDLGSVNGTRVRDRPIGRGETVSIQPGETIAIGSSVVIVHVRSRQGAQPALADSPTYTEASLRELGSDGHDDAMQTITRLAERAAAGTINVLVLGETGVGKDVMAAAIHRLSPRRSAPYVCLNCAALSESLLESELFGYERGAFTGAVGAKQGLLETAEGGTLFLDEVGEMPIATQAKLLRVLETREVTRIGSVRPRKIDFRFVAATNRDLEADVERGHFRRDLFFRLNGISIRIPPLRERRAEIRPLAETFLREVCEELSRPPPRLSDVAVAALERKPWPGNIRELKNVIERAVLLCSGSEIGMEHLPEERTYGPADRGSGRGSIVPDIRRVVIRNAVPGSEPKERFTASDITKPTGGLARNRISHEAGHARAPDGPRGRPRSHSETREPPRTQPDERQRILDALAACAGNQSRAAKLLAMPRRTFVARLDRYHIPRPKKSETEGQTEGQTEDRPETGPKDRTDG